MKWIPKTNVGNTPHGHLMRKYKFKSVVNWELHLCVREKNILFKIC